MAKKKRKNAPGAGRPEIAPEDRKVSRTYRCTDAEYLKIEAAGQPNVSEWTRKTLLRAARRKK